MSRIYSFNSLIGNSTTITLLKRSLRNETFKKFSIFGGVLGTGKSTCAGITGMALTCLHPVDGEPCMQCEHCKVNKLALEETGTSPYLNVINLGKKNKFDDVEELIKDVFVLQGGNTKQVYIFEEAHAIKQIRGGFTAFLAEIDRMPKNVYIIMCTTAVNDIPADLKSRAIIYNFNRLNSKDSAMLAKQLATKKHLGMPNDIVPLVVRASKGIPRDIEKLIEFAAENAVSPDEMRDYLQEVGTDALIELFGSMKNAEFSTTIDLYQDIMDRVSIQQFIYSVKDFCMNVAFLIDGGIRGEFTSAETEELRRIISSQELQKIIQIIEHLGKESTDADVGMAVMKMRLVLQGMTIKDVVAQNSTIAAREAIVSTRRVGNTENPAPKLKPLSTKSLSAFGDYESKN